MAAMVVTPQTRPPALATCFDPPFPATLPLPEKGTAVVVGSKDKVGGTNVGVVNVAVGMIMGLVLGTIAGESISSPGTTSGVSKTTVGSDEKPKRWRRIIAYRRRLALCWASTKRNPTKSGKVQVRFDCWEGASRGNEPRWPREPSVVRSLLQVQGWGICVRKSGATQDQDQTKECPTHVPGGWTIVQYCVYSFHLEGKLGERRYHWTKKTHAIASPP